MVTATVRFRRIAANGPKWQQKFHHDRRMDVANTEKVPCLRLNPLRGCPPLAFA